MTQDIIEGEGGRAWTVVVPTKGKVPDAECISWVVEAPWCHENWSQYLFTCIHLRPQDGLPPAVINLDGATHEFCVYVIARTTPTTPDQDLAKDMFNVMRPVAHNFQFIAESDEKAIEKVRDCVWAVINKKMSCWATNQDGVANFFGKTSWNDLEAREKMIKRSVADAVTSAIAKVTIDSGQGVVKFGWDAYRRYFVPKDMSPSDLTVVQNAFYCGAQHLFASVNSVLNEGEDPTDEDIERMNKISEELATWARQFKQIHSEALGHG